jgi:hypothetical protein
MDRTHRGEEQLKTRTILMVLVSWTVPSLFAAENATASNDADNLLKNPGFENGSPEQGRPPADWTFITASGQHVNGGLTDAAAHTGSFSVYIDKPLSEKDKWQVLCFNTLVETGATYEFSVWVKPDPQNPMRGDTKGTVSIEWKDADGNEITRVAAEAWTPKTFAGSPDWVQVKIKAPTPEKVTAATFVITYYAGSAKDAGSSFLIDDAVAKKVGP